LRPNNAAESGNGFCIEFDGGSTLVKNSCDKIGANKFHKPGSEEVNSPHPLYLNQNSLGSS